MPSLPTTNDTVSCKELFDCQEPPYQNTPHCIFHFPGEEKADDFNLAFMKMAKESDFTGFWFPEKAAFDFNFDEPLIFSKATFNGEVRFKARVFKRPVSFDFATFNKPVSFRESIFEHVNFSSTVFQKAVTFRGAIFKEDANFHATVFEEDADFSSIVEPDIKQTVFGKQADFSQARFKGRADFIGVALKNNAIFYYAKFFSQANFSDAKFKGIANFVAVTFVGGTSFNSAVLEQSCNLYGATFEYRVFFDATMFKGEANFMLTNFKDSLRFKGSQVFDPKSAPNFKEAKFDKPEMVTFHSVTLRPYWFVDVNASGFTLTNVTWDWGRITIDGEINGITNNYEDVPSPYPLLGIACWNFAVNAEENHRYEEASMFRYMAMEVRRRSTLLPNAYWRVHWKEARTVLVRFICSFRRDRKEQRRILNETRRFWKSIWESVRILHWLYWLLSGYGERIVRALTVLMGIWVVFACIYAAMLRDKAGTPLRWRAFPYSAAVMMLQRPEPPPTAIGQGLVIVETVLGPIQAALLALAIRRKFMR